MFWTLFTFLFCLVVCFLQIRFTFYNSSNRQGGKQTAAILYLESFAQVLALPNVIANKEWQLVPSAVLVFLIWITSQTLSETNRSFLIDIKLDQRLVTSAPGQIWLQPVTCKSVGCSSKTTKFKNTCRKPQTNPFIFWNI